MRHIAAIFGLLIVWGMYCRAQTLNLGPDTSVCNSVPFVLDAGPGFVSYDWSTNSSAETIVVPATGEYSVTVTDTLGHVQVDSIHVTIYNAPIVSFVFNNQCVGVPVQFFNITRSVDSVATWFWTFGDDSTSNDSTPSHVYDSSGNYNVELYVTTIYGCADSETLPMVVYGLPIVTLGPTDSINVGDTAQLNAVTRATVFSWQPTIYLSDSTVLNPLAIPPSTTQFTITVTDSLGCMNSDSEIVFVNQPPTANDVVVNINARTTVVIDVQGSDIDPNGEPLTTTIFTYPKNGTATLLNNDSIQYVPGPTFTGLDTIVYQVCNTGRPPQCAIANVLITVANVPPIVHNYTIVTQVNISDTLNVLVNDTDILGQQLSVDAIGAPNNGVVTDLTNTSNGLISYTPNEGYSGTDTFYYVVCNNGTPAMCDTGYVFVSVLKEVLKVSNSFSPNGDGIHDYFEIDGISAYPNNHIIIFTRWGDKLFEETGYHNEWNGIQADNENVPDGIYFYALNLGDGSKELTGWVMIKR